MRGGPAFAVLLGACATAPNEPEEFSGCGTMSVHDTSHEIVWQAACRALAWEGSGTVLRVDSARWEIRCGDRMECHAPSGRDPGGGLLVTLSFDDMADWFLFQRRLHQALDMLREGKPLPPTPPPYPAR